MAINGRFWMRIVFYGVMGLFTVLIAMTSYIQAQTDNRIDDNKAKIEKLDDTKADKKYMDEKFKAQEKWMESEFRGIRELIRQVSR